MRKILYASTGVVIIAVIAIMVLRERTLTAVVERHIGAVPVIEISGPLDKAGARKIVRALGRAESAQPTYIVISFDSPGGELTGTLEVADTIEALSVPTVGLVYEGVAGTVLMIAAVGEIYFAPTGVCGAAGPIVMAGNLEINNISQKIVSDMTSRVGTLAEANGHDPSVFEAMMNTDGELTLDGKVWKSGGTLLTLTAREAMDIALASGIAASPEDVVAAQEAKK